MEYERQLKSLSVMWWDWRKIRIEIQLSLKTYWPISHGPTIHKRCNLPEGWRKSLESLFWWSKLMSTMGGWLFGNASRRINPASNKKKWHILTTQHRVEVNSVSGIFISQKINKLASRIQNMSNKILHTGHNCVNPSQI